MNLNILPPSCDLLVFIFHIPLSIESMLFCGVRKFSIYSRQGGEKTVKEN